MKYGNLLLAICFLTGSFSLYSCKKYLDAKPDKKFAVPSDLADYQSLLDYYTKLNDNGVAAPNMSSDNLYITKTEWETIDDETSRKIYLWQRDNVFTPGFNYWNDIYISVYYANTAITNVPQINRKKDNAQAWDNCMGEGLFFRANAFLQIASTWCLAYDKHTANEDLGIPLRLNTDFNEPSKRSTLQQSYEQIIKDLKQSINLLPIAQAGPVRPNKAAAYGLLARTYLYMQDYQNAYFYADSSLQLNSDLMNYNDLDPSAYYAIPEFNKEVQFADRCTDLGSVYGNVDSTLYRSYDNNDLRKSLYFKPHGDGTQGYYGSYDGAPYSFIGVATDEEYLIKAECEARMNKVDEAMKDLNSLLVTRWKTGTFVPISAINQNDALHKIINERRKELLFRCLRWMDIKRLNKEGWNITLKRIFDGVIYTLPPNDPRYALPIPDDIIQISGMQQNPG